jgi:glycosyltransferase involved in cell wall biosynthesis
MERKKILHFINGLEIGGAENQLLRILPELEKYHENLVCCAQGRGPIGKLLEEKGIQVYYLDMKNIFDFFAAIRFGKIIKNCSPDILVTYLIHADLYGRVLGKLFQIKKIVSSKRGALLQWEWLSFFDRLTKKLVDHYLIQTETARKEWMKKLNLPEKKFTIIPNGINIEKFRCEINKEEKKKQLEIKENSTVITCISKLRRGKGHDILLKSFEKFYQYDNNAILLIVGDGEREEELKNSIVNFNSKNSIKFLSNRTDIAEILSISDIFTLPTEKEGMSNAIIEAMIMGVPIITTDIPANRDVLENKKTGILIPVNNIDSLTEKIKILMADKFLWEKMSQDSKIEAEKKFDVQVVAKKFAEFYEKI